MYKYYQPNDKNKKACDCVVRALTKVCNAEWKDIYARLCTIGVFMMDMPNAPEVYRKLLADEGFQMNTIKVTRGSKRPTVKSFSKEHKTGTYVLEIANHVVAVVDGNYYDIWDCGDKCLYRYHEKV